MTDQLFCVCWNRETNRLEMLPFGVLVDLNNASFLDDKPPRGVLRAEMTELRAKEFIRGFSRLMAERSLKKLDAVQRLEAEEEAARMVRARQPKIDGMN